MPNARARALAKDKTIMEIQSHITTKFSKDEYWNVRIINSNDGPAFALMNGVLWVSLTRSWPDLNIFQRAALLSCEIAVLEPDEGGLYVRFDNFISVMPVELQPRLRRRKRELVAFTQQKQQRHNDDNKQSP